MAALNPLGERCNRRVGRMSIRAGIARDAPDDQLRIAHVIDGLGPGGAEALLVTNLKHLRRDRHHTVVTLFRAGAPRYPAEEFWRTAIEGLNVDIVSLDAVGAGDLPAAAWKLAGWLRSERIDIVHSHLFYANLVAAFAARAADVPLISSLHTLSYETEVVARYRNPRSWKHPAARRLESKVLQFASERVIAVGTSVAASAIDRLRLDPASVVVLHNPVDLAAIDCVSHADLEAVRRELKLEANDRLLLVVGRLIPSKAQHVAIRALQQVRWVHPTAHLALVGAPTDPEYARRLELEVAELGLTNVVHFLGGRRDVPAWLRAADVFLFPTEYEGLPVALAEATAAGCACVATDIPSNREVIDDALVGALVPVGDAESLAARASALLTNEAERARIGSRAASRSRERFSPHSASAALDSIYDEVLANRRD